MRIELGGVPVRILVPDGLAGTNFPVEDIKKRLHDYDEDNTNMANGAEISGKLKRNVGLINEITGKYAVNLRKYRNDHPFGIIKASENIVSFRTNR